MPNPTLLADLAWRLASSPEDVATDALTLILNRSGHARRAMNELIGLWSGSVCSVARWKSQVVGADGSRTDMQGEYDDRAVRVILENKFQAGLTPNQPRTYLKRLPENGVLAFLAPTTRTASLVIELADRVRLQTSAFTPLVGSYVASVSAEQERLLELADRAGLQTSEFMPVGASHAAKAQGDKTLVVTNWEEVLTRVASALEQVGDHNALADLRQLQGLAEKADTEAFIPLTATDITGATGRRIVQFNQILDEVWKQVSHLDGVNKKGMAKGTGPGHYSQYFAMHGFHCQLIFWAERWAKFGISPIWLGVRDQKGQFPEPLRVPLARVLPDPAWLKADEQGPSVGLWLPLRLTEGREKDVVVRNVVRQIQRVATVLLAHAGGEPPAEPAAPASV